MSGHFLMAPFFMIWKGVMDYAGSDFECRN